MIVIRRTSRCKLFIGFAFVILYIFTDQPIKSQGLNHPMDSLLHTNHIFKNSIKTIQLHKMEWELSYPLIDINSNEKLILSFDDLSDNVGDYYYSFIHCDATWNPTSLLEQDYLDGFPENQINDYEFSFNTTVKYIHYSLSFPNEDVNFKISGNYILIIYQNYDKSDVLFTRRFMVTENLVDVGASMRRPANTQFFDDGQEIQIAVKYPRYSIFDPYSEVKVAVSQNGRWDNAVLFDKPSFVRTSELIYDFDRRNIFYGGSEYRYFDIKSMRYQTQYIQYIDFRHPYYHVSLFPSESKARLSYFYEQDINGRYYVRIQEGDKNEIEADYAKVYFTLKRESPYNMGEVYIFGALSDWTCNENSHMIYNFETQAYEGSLMLKQGYYNYEYVVKENGITYADNTVFEGSHFETENDYLIFIYHRAAGSRYDRIVGYAMVNSLTNPH